jgi:uncharacterized membrane protein (DUF4010 family)
MLAGTAFLYLGQVRSSEEGPQLRIRNPFDLSSVLWLVALLAAIMLVTNVLATNAGSAGVYLMAGLSGILDVDALTLSMTRLAGVQVPAVEASTAILIAAASNTLSKSAIAAVVGGSRLGMQVGAVNALGIAALGLAIWFAK